MASSWHARVVRQRRARNRHVMDALRGQGLGFEATIWVLCVRAGAGLATQTVVYASVTAAHKQNCGDRHEKVSGSKGGAPAPRVRPPRSGSV